MFSNDLLRQQKAEKAVKEKEHYKRKLDSKKASLCHDENNQRVKKSKPELIGGRSSAPPKSMFLTSLSGKRFGGGFDNIPEKVRVWILAILTILIMMILNV